MLCLSGFELYSRWVPLLFDIRFSYKHYNFSRGCLLVKTASKTVTRLTVNNKLSLAACEMRGNLLPFKIIISLLPFFASIALLATI